MLWEELLCRESCNLIPVVPVFCVCVFIPGHSGSDSHRSPCLVFPNVVQQRHSADSTQISGAVWLVRVRLTPCLLQGNLGGCTRGGVVTSGLCWIRRVRELPVCVGLTFGRIPVSGAPTLLLGTARVGAVVDESPFCIH